MEKRPDVLKTIRTHGNHKNLYKFFGNGFAQDSSPDSTALEFHVVSTALASETPARPGLLELACPRLVEESMGSTINRADYAA